MPAFDFDESFPFTAPLDAGGDATHEVHVRGQGRPILILQELPGIAEPTFALVQRLNRAGYRVYLPHLLGTFGRIETWRNTRHLFCVRREFEIFARGRQSPIAAWMRALCAEIARREDGQRIGVIGMCLTGSFAIPLMAEDAVAGAVASQPSLPFVFCRSPHMDAGDIGRANAAMADKGPALAMRYRYDPMATGCHMARLKRDFGANLETETYPGARHSLLTAHFRQDAFDRVLAYFDARFA